MVSNLIVGLRHLEDHNELSKNLFDAPLMKGQELKAKQIAKQLYSIAIDNNFESIRICLSPQMRAIETATLIYEYLNKKIPVNIIPQKGLRELDQGVPVLPKDYKDGDHLKSLESAWDIFCYETYENKNLAYKFGNPEGKHKMHKQLIGKFERYGECMLDMLPRQYDFFERLISGEFQNKNELLALCSHNTTLLTLCEILEISRKYESSSLETLKSKDLAYDCWNIYLEEGGKVFPEKLDYGQVITYDLSQLRKSNFVKYITEAKQVYSEARRNRSLSLGQILKTKENDYSSLSCKFKRITGKELDDRRELDKSCGFYPVSIIIPYYKDGDKILNTLDAIEHQNLSKSEKSLVEVVIVDDGSFDDLDNLIKNEKYSFNLEVVYSKTNMGRAWSRNIGARTSKNDILIFIDSDVMISGNYLREHTVRNQLIHNNIYVSLVYNIDDIFRLLEKFSKNEVLEVPIEFNDYRVFDRIPAGSLGLYDVKKDMKINLLDMTNNFREFGNGMVIGNYDLACTVSTNNVSCARELFNKAGGFSPEFDKGWGLEDTYFGACCIAVGAKVVPVISTGVYHQNHPPRSGNDKKKEIEFNRNIELYKNLMKSPFNLSLSN